MKKAPIPKNELQRIASLNSLGILDTPPEERFDQLTRSATKIFHVPISTLTLIDANREWFKSCQGLDQREGDRAISFCGHALVEDEILVIPDTQKDDRFADNPMVTGEPFIRFYAGVPIKSADGQRIGVFCIKDTKPREFSKDDKEILKGLASWAELEINLHDGRLTAVQQNRFLEKFVQGAAKSDEISFVKFLVVTTLVIAASGFIMNFVNFYDTNRRLQAAISALYSNPGAGASQNISKAP
jgi:GAF domain-containing protein